ncbi:unnamed protein product [Peniophora sp. CBMAI 1063]|nr:unnamed protein product [Peniophora sp. CBMAI 1063]
MTKRHRLSAMLASSYSDVMPVFNSLARLMRHDRIAYIRRDHPIRHSEAAVKDPHADISSRKVVYEGD